MIYNSLTPLKQYRSAVTRAVCINNSTKSIAREGRITSQCDKSYPTSGWLTRTGVMQSIKMGRGRILTAFGMPVRQYHRGAMTMRAAELVPSESFSLSSGFCRALIQSDRNRSGVNLTPTAFSGKFTHSGTSLSPRGPSAKPRLTAIIEFVYWAEKL